MLPCLCCLQWLYHRDITQSCRCCADSSVGFCLKFCDAGAPSLGLSGAQPVPAGDHSVPGAPDNPEPCLHGDANRRSRQGCTRACCGDTGVSPGPGWVSGCPAEHLLWEPQTWRGDPMTILWRARAWCSFHGPGCSCCQDRHPGGPCVVHSAVRLPGEPA